MAEILSKDQIIVPKERRHVFNGYTLPAPARVNRPFRKRKVSTLGIVFLLFLLAGVLVSYIGNIIAVNELVVQVNQLKTSYSSIENMNNILRMEVNRKMSMERITKIASEEMGMAFPKQPPLWFELPASDATQPSGNEDHFLKDGEGSQ
jgi:cell division protein FtsL